MADPSCQDIVKQTIELNKSRLTALGHQIWAHPENAFKEFSAHDCLVEFLEQQEFAVERHFHSPTAFRAVFSPTKGSADLTGNVREGHPINVCFLCEYDAVEGLGHASGHNLLSESSIAAALAVKECLVRQKINGMVTVLGTPGEESCGGVKADMIDKGVFNDISFVMKLLPLNKNMVFPGHSALNIVTVVYSGKAAHASMYPWEGKNALDAAVICYQNIAILKAGLKYNWNVNGIIVQGGTSPNIIPDKVELKFWLRAPEFNDIFKLKTQVAACFDAGATATGCSVDYDFDDSMYYPLQHSKKLGELYQQQALSLGMDFTKDPADLMCHTGSSDLGNISQVVPCLCPAFDIGTDSATHSAMFAEHAGKLDASLKCLQAAKALALVAAEVMALPSIHEDIMKEYKINRTSAGKRLQPRVKVDSFCL